MGREHRRLITVAAFLLTSSACGGDDNTSRVGAMDASVAPDAAEQMAPDADTKVPDASLPDAQVVMPVGQTVVVGSDGSRTVSIGPIHAEPFEENTVCIVADLGNDALLSIRSLHSKLGHGSHHMVAYRTDEPVTASPVPCGPDPFNNNLLNITQSHQNDLVYPAAAILELSPRQHVKLEMHYFNDEDSAIEIEGSVKFAPDPNPTAGLKAVRMLFSGALSLSVPQGMSTSRYYESMPTDANVFALATHTHQWGTSATLARASEPDGANPTLLYESMSWSEPPLGTFDPALTFDSGEGLLLTCNYDNLSGRDISFGTSAQDEMCFFWAFYY